VQLLSELGDVAAEDQPESVVNQAPGHGEDVARAGNAFRKEESEKSNRRRWS
jgi:hypothetical protein